MLSKRTTNIGSRNIQVISEGFIHQSLDVQTEVAIAAAGADATLISDSNYGRVGFDVHIPAKYTPSKISTPYQIVNKTGAGPFTYTLRPWSPTSEISVAIPVGSSLITGASGFAPGTQQPPPVKRDWFEHFQTTRILKETVVLEGGQQALEEWAELSQAKDGSTLRSRALNEAEFRLRVQMNDYMLNGQKNTNGLTGDNKFGETNPVLSDDGLLQRMALGSMIQYYTGVYSKDNFDVIKFLLASQGVGKGLVDYYFGQELGLGIENSGLQFLNEFSGGTDLYSRLEEVGFSMKYFKKNGITSCLCELQEFSNPVMYGTSGYNYETLGIIAPNAKVTATLNERDAIGNSMGAAERRPLNNLTLGYLSNRGEDRKMILTDQSGVNGMGLKTTEDWDQAAWYLLTEMCVFVLAENQLILVLRSDD